MSATHESFKVTANDQGARLDQVVAKMLTNHSRAQVQKWIAAGHVSVNNEVVKINKFKLNEHDTVCVKVAQNIELEDTPEAIDLEIIFEDDDLLIVNKPAGLVAHPGAGNPNGTLVNALLHYNPALKTLPRAGLIHRLDKGTTGLIIAAKHTVALTKLSRLMQQREIKREYLAVCQGTMISGSSIDLAIDRDPRSRIKMAVVEGGKKAVTHYRVKERFRAHTLIQVQLETGRTHQIRVHMMHTGYPLIGDPVYRKQIALESKISQELKQACQQFKRQALHAHRLTLTNPINNEPIQVAAPIPEDLNGLIIAMRADRDLNQQ